MTVPHSGLTGLGPTRDKLCVDLLVDYDVGQLDLVVREPVLGHARLDHLNLVLEHVLVLDLAIAHTVPR